MIELHLSGGDKLAEALQARLDALKKLPVLRAGFLETAEYPDGTPVAQVAFWNEYGTSTAPARPFFRQTIAAKHKGWGVLLGQALAATQDPIQALGTVGEQIKDDLTTAIVEFSDPPNAATTIAKKGFNNPLINKGTMQNMTGWDLEG